MNSYKCPKCGASFLLAKDLSNHAAHHCVEAQRQKAYDAEISDWIPTTGISFGQSESGAFRGDGGSFGGGGASESWSDSGASESWSDSGSSSSSSSSSSSCDSSSSSDSGGSCDSGGGE